MLRPFFSPSSAGANKKAPTIRGRGSGTVSRLTRLSIRVRRNNVEHSRFAFAQERTVKLIHTLGCGHGASR
jgi:hypothetical protein